MAQAFGDQPAHVVRTATEREHDDAHSKRVSPHTAMAFAGDRNLEREAVVDERDILRDALTRSMGDSTVGDIKTEFERRVEAGDFVVLDHRPGDTGRSIHHARDDRP